MHGGKVCLASSPGWGGGGVCGLPQVHWGKYSRRRAAKALGGLHLYGPAKVSLKKTLGFRDPG